MLASKSQHFLSYFQAENGNKYYQRTDSIVLPYAHHHCHFTTNHITSYNH